MTLTLAIATVLLALAALAYFSRPRRRPGPRPAGDVETVGPAFWLARAERLRRRP